MLSSAHLNFLVLCTKRFFHFVHLMQSKRIVGLGGSRIGLQSASHWGQKLKHSGPGPLAQANIDDWLIRPLPLSASPLIPTQSTFLV